MAIGIFDSGIGGLTVAKAIHEVMPGLPIHYLGDTARLPYGTKSPQAINAYLSQAIHWFESKAISHLVVACNTASTEISRWLAHNQVSFPITGVIQPGVMAAAQHQLSQYLILATDATIEANAYQRALGAQVPGAMIHGQPCALWVALAEEGWHQGPLTESILKVTLENQWEALTQAPTGIILGCTHFPLLKEALSRIVPPQTQLIDSAAAIASELAEFMKPKSSACVITSGHGAIDFSVTDHPARFKRIGQLFWPEVINATTPVETVSLNQVSHRFVANPS